MHDDEDQRYSEFLDNMFSECISNIITDGGLNAFNIKPMRSLVPENVLLKATRLLDNRSIRFCQVIDTDLAFYFIESPTESHIMPADIKWCSCEDYHRLSSDQNPRSIICPHMLAVFFIKHKLKTHLIPFEEFKETCKSKFSLNLMLQRNNYEKFDSEKIY